MNGNRGIEAHSAQSTQKTRKVSPRENAHGHNRQEGRSKDEETAPGGSLRPA
jgi:hypothetical protein